MPVNVMFTYAVCKECKDRLTLPLIPPLYRLTDRSRLPQEQLRKVLEWKPGTERGLILVGPSGAGKTRCMWELVRDHGIINAEIFDCVSFGHTLAKKYMLNDAEMWLEYVGKDVPVVIFDDLGKLKLTERVEAELFGVIDRRVSHMLPIIATTQLSADELADSATVNRGAAMVRRLRDSCDIVQF